MDFLQELNDAQREAVLHIDGPLMVIAGAGSGKTRVLTYRAAFILDQGLAAAPEVLALTFTNKAAREMKTRISTLVGPEARSVVMGTFHSIFSRILRVEAEKIGFTSSYTIYDSDDSKRMVKALIKEQGLSDKVYKPPVVQHAISMAKNSMVSPQELQNLAMDDFNLQVAKIYALYEDRMFKANVMDFDDLLIKPIQLFRSHPEVMHKYQHRFRYIMVDEYQDTNHAQYLLTKTLASVHENICVVGDDAQSIYAFRGANIQNILNFKKDYPEAREIKLEQNYRSTKTIVNAANAIIARNRDQIQKTVYTENESGELITLIETTSDQDESRRVTNMIREQKQLNNFFNRDIAVLYRTNAQSRSIEDELRRAGLRYRIYGGLSFYQRKEIKDAVAYLRLAINPRDEQALLRVINYPTRGIGKTTIEKLTVLADQMGVTLWEAMSGIEKAGLPGRIVNAVKNFTTMIESFGVVARKKDAYEAANYIAKHSGLLKELHSEHSTEGLGRWENLQELLNAAQAFVEDPDNEVGNLEAFLADISLFTDQDKQEEDDDFITLMTIHSAKGLEFKSVFLVGMEENIFPSPMSLESRADLEEERRLFYVAITRAEKRLTLTYARSRFRYGDMQFNEPSRFLDELEEKFLHKPARSARSELDKVLGARPTAPRQSIRRSQRPSRPIQNRKEPSFEPSDPSLIDTGMLVRHERFGKGKVIAVEGEGKNRKATVDFSDKGRRVLLLKYAKLLILN